ncbi:MAG: sulfite exporter TauE/SafE family protein [Gemmatimonadaceae bacterium]|nr:sulfite exporter TauE/SafE family protein [Gemmatimonadaceae bacterium]
MDFSVVADKLGNPALAIPVMFVAGVLTSLTPCVYPMIPITAGIVGGQNVAGGRRRTIVLTLSYVLGLALVYAILGLIAGLTGSLFGSISTNPWLYFAMANFLIIAGLAMLDVIHIAVPARFLMPTSGTKGRASAAFGMGAASGLVAAPCSAPVMAGVLTWVGTTRNGALGFIYLFVFSLGMTSLLIVIGLFAGSVTALPQSGRWMLWIKRAFAVILFGAAEYYLIQTGKLLI